MCSANELAPHLYQKPWVLLRNSHARPYFTSDNPVAFQNSKDKAPGSLGLGALGIEIYLPLSSRLTLSMMCTSYVEQTHDIMRITRLWSFAGALSRDLAENSRRVEALLSGIRNSTPLDQSPENVTNHNSLQVLSANRYVYSSTDDFTLVKHMLEADPELRLGGREVVVDNLD